MLAFSVIVAILVSTAAVAYVAWPLVQPGPAPVIIEDDRLTDLIGRKDATLSAIKELEFDYRTGKLSEEDYQRMDQRLRRQAIGYIQQIEKLAPESTQLDGRIEAEILALRKTVNVAASPAPVVQPVPQPVAQRIPEAVSARPSQQAAVLVPAAATASMRFCTNCGKPVQSGHKFCANCGTAVPPVTE